MTTDYYVIIQYYYYYYYLRGGKLLQHAKTLLFAWETNHPRQLSRMPVKLTGPHVLMSRTHFKFETKARKMYSMHHGRSHNHSEVNSSALTRNDILEMMEENNEKLRKEFKSMVVDMIGGMRQNILKHMNVPGVMPPEKFFYTDGDISAKVEEWERIIPELLKNSRVPQLERMR